MSKVMAVLGGGGSTPTPNGFVQCSTSPASGTSSSSFSIQTSEGDLIIMIAYGGSSSKLAYNRFARNTITGVSSVQDLGYFYDSGTAYASGSITACVASGTIVVIRYANSCYLKAFKATRV